jgi:putative phage-type endonuclease
MLDLVLRRSYLGATDLVAISGLSPWSKPGDVWMEKTGRSLGFEGNAATEAGNDLEPVVALRHARRMEKMGIPVQLGELNDPVFDKEFPFIAGNPDRIYLNRKRVLECKTAGENQLYESRYGWGEDMETNAVPPYYLGQVNHYIGELEFEDGFLSSFFLGRGRIQRDYPIVFDRELFDLLRHNGAAFWNRYVAPNVQPPIEMFSHEQIMLALADSAHKHGGKAGILVEADPLLIGWAEKYKDLSDRMDALEAPKKMLAGKIAGWISSHNGTKVIHPLGSFTYQQPEPKPGVQEFDAEAAWKELHAALAGKLPVGVFDQIVALTSEIQSRFTKTVTPEPATPRLHTRWK